MQHAIQRNPDGCGFAYRESPDDDWKAIRGMFTWQRFNNIIARHVGDGTQHETIIHFRLATHGVTGESNAQPIAVSNRGVFAHNGMINGMDDETLSDSRLLVARIVTPLVRSQYWSVLDDTLSLIARESHSRFALAVNGRKTVLYGDWHKDDDGCYYSNKNSHAVAASIFTPGTSFAERWNPVCDWCGRQVAYRVPVRFGATTVRVCVSCSDSVKGIADDDVPSHDKCEWCSTWAPEGDLHYVSIPVPSTGDSYTVRVCGDCRTWAASESKRGNDNEAAI